MKPLLSLLCILSGLSALAQQPAITKWTDTLPITAQKAVVAALKDRSGDHNSIFPGLFSGVASYVTNSGSSISFNPTFFGLAHLTNKPDSARYSIAKYQHSIFWQDLQLNLSASPDNKSNFTVDSASGGLTYAIIKNTNLKHNAYQKVLKTKTAFGVSIGSFAKSKQQQFNIPASLLAKFADSNYDESILNNYPELVKMIKQEFHITGKIADATDYKAAVENYLARVPVWTVSAKDNFDFPKSRNDRIQFASDFSVATFPVNGHLTSVDIAAIYQWQDDTLETTANLSRKIFSTSVGLNFQPWSSFEIKPAFSYVNTNGPLYKKETANSINGSITFRLKINDGVWLPVSLQYTPHNGEIFGFLSVQYSL